MTNIKVNLGNIQYHQDSKGLKDKDL